jgi:hypothetical protein
MTVDEVLAGFERLTGRSSTEILERNRRQHYAATEHAKDTVDQAERLARAKRKARRKAELAYSFWLRHHQQADLDEYVAEQRRVRELDTELREVLCHDQELIDEVTRKVAR